MKQSAKLELFNYLFTEFEKLNVPVITTKELNQDLDYPFIAIQSVSDNISKFSFDSYGGKPTATIHVWGTEEDKGYHDSIYMDVQGVLLGDITLPNYFLYNPQITVNESTEIDSNQTLLHTVINIEYTSH